MRITSTIVIAAVTLASTNAAGTPSRSSLRSFREIDDYAAIRDMILSSFDAKDCEEKEQGASKSVFCQDDDKDAAITSEAGALTLSQCNMQGNNDCSMESLTNNPRKNIQIARRTLGYVDQHEEAKKLMYSVFGEDDCTESGGKENKTIFCKQTDPWMDAILTSFNGRLAFFGQCNVQGDEKCQDIFEFPGGPQENVRLVKEALGLN